jgi:hypothetical protein
MDRFNEGAVIGGDESGGIRVLEGLHRDVEPDDLRCLCYPHVLSVRGPVDEMPVVDDLDGVRRRESEEARTVGGGRCQTLVELGVLDERIYRVVDDDEGIGGYTVGLQLYENMKGRN